MVVLVVRGLVLVVHDCSLVCPWCLGRLVLVFVSCGGPWSCSWVVSRGLFVGRHLVSFFVVVPV